MDNSHDFNEPVAWTLKTRNYGLDAETWDTVEYRDYKWDENCEPLFAAPKALEPLTDRFAEAYWKACDSSQPLDWMEAALAAQQILQTNRPETKGTPC